MTPGASLFLHDQGRVLTQSERGEHPSPDQARELADLVLEIVIERQRQEIERQLRRHQARRQRFLSALATLSATTADSPRCGPVLKSSPPEASLYNKLAPQHGDFPPAPAAPLNSNPNGSPEVYARVHPFPNGRW